VCACAAGCTGGSSATSTKPAYAAAVAQPVAVSAKSLARDGNHAGHRREVDEGLPREAVVRRYLAVRRQRRCNHAQYAPAFVALSFRDALRPIARPPSDQERDKRSIAANFALQEHFSELQGRLGRTFCAGCRMRALRQRIHASGLCRCLASCSSSAPIARTQCTQLCLSCALTCARPPYMHRTIEPPARNSVKCSHPTQGRGRIKARNGKHPVGRTVYRAAEWKLPVSLEWRPVRLYPAMAEAIRLMRSVQSAILGTMTMARIMLINAHGGDPCSNTTTLKRFCRRTA